MLLLSHISFLQGHAPSFSVIHSFTKCNDSSHLGPWRDLQRVFSQSNMHRNRNAPLPHRCASVSQRRTRAPVADISARPLIALGLSNGSIVCLESLREDGGTTLKDDDRNINSGWKGAAFPQPLSAFPVNHRLFAAAFT